MSKRLCMVFLCSTHEGAAYEGDDRLLGGLVVDLLWMWIPVSMHRPEHRGFRNEPRGHGDAPRTSQGALRRSRFQIGRQERQQRVASLGEPELGELGVVCGATVEELDPNPVVAKRA